MQGHHDILRIFMNVDRDPIEKLPDDNLAIGKSREGCIPQGGNLGSQGENALPNARITQVCRLPMHWGVISPLLQARSQSDRLQRFQNLPADQLVNQADFHARISQGPPDFGIVAAQETRSDRSANMALRLWLMII